MHMHVSCTHNQIRFSNVKYIHPLLAACLKKVNTVNTSHSDWLDLGQKIQDPLPSVDCYQMVEKQSAARSFLVLSNDS